RDEALHLNMQLAQRDSQLHTAKITIEALTLELAHLRRIRFGSKTEALSAQQRLLFDEAVAEDIAAIEATTEAVLPPQVRPPRARAGRQPLPDHLPRIEHRHEPDRCTCGTCGQDLVKIGEDISEQLDIEPARFFVHRHIRPQYACRGCESITAAPIPPALIDGGIASAGLQAWIMISKHVDHLPFYRLEQIAARDGVPLPRSNLAEWGGRIGFALQPLADCLANRLRKRSVLHADETPVRQLDPGRGKTLRAYLWGYRSNDLEEGDRLVLFDYQTDRRGQHAKGFLQDWRGALMVDDYGGYKALFGLGIVELACLAHLRRKFFDLHAANQSPIAAEALRRIAELYAIEQQGRDYAAAARFELRRHQAKPKLDDFRAWLIRTRLTTADGSGTARAIDHSLKRWEALLRYLDDGRYPIDNNPLENAFRPIAVGKKNWMFTGSERAGQRAAAVQSLLATAKLNGIEPYAWLKDILEKLPVWPNSRIDELLPLRSTYKPN
ncbi:MAG: IS66 family transposase, partial [Acidobacteriaceae bacterium]